MISVIEDAKSVKQCIEIATCDAYDDYEIIAGWHSCFEEVFEDNNGVRVFGEEVSLVGFEISGTTLFAVCTDGDDEEHIAVESLKLIKPTKSQRLWLRAWLKWSGFEY